MGDALNVAVFLSLRIMSLTNIVGWAYSFTGLISPGLIPRSSAANRILQSKARLGLISRSLQRSEGRYPFACGRWFITSQLAAFKRKKLGTDTSLPAAGYFIICS